MDVLEVSAVVAGWDQAEPPHFTLDIGGRLEVIFRPDVAPHHRVVGVLVQPRHQVAGRDGGHGGGAHVLERQRLLVGLGGERPGGGRGQRQPGEGTSDGHPYVQHQVELRRERERTHRDVPKTPA